MKQDINPQLAIANAIVKITREHTGRGPTKARTVMRDDFVAVVMEDTLTKGERTLAERGERETVRGMRRAFQESMRSDMADAIREITGREVVAFLSDNHVDPDVAVEAFVLDGLPSRDNAAAS